jgi:hypothetical protein
MQAGIQLPVPPRRSPVKATIRIGFVNPSSPWIAIARRFQHGYTEI